MRNNIMEIVKADLSTLTEVARLFDLYRQFYECPPDAALAAEFIEARMRHGESDIFLALDERHACGFVQLYPSFCSVEAAKIYILHDLYVEMSHRNSGLGKILMDRATRWANENGAARLDLLTEHTNNAAQHLYEKLGYKKVLEDYYAYSLAIE